MMFLLGVLIVAVGVGISIALHELGHLIPAKRFGVRCPQYMIGFGPTLWAGQRGDTSYGIKAIPLGGFVKMIGMFPPKPGADPTSLRASSTGRWATMVDDARSASAQELAPGDEDRVFYKLSTPRKLVVMLGGPVMNLLLATLILGGIVTTYGMAVPVDGTVVTSVVQCVRPADQPTGQRDQACTATDQPSPAARAGLQPGDEIVRIDGTPIARTSDIAAAIRPKAGQQTQLVVLRDGSERTLLLTPIESTLPVYDDEGTPRKGPDGAALTERAGYVGMTNAQRMTVERQSVTVVPGLVADGVQKTAGVMVRLPQKMVEVWNAAFGTAERDINGPISVVGVGRIAGEVTDGQIAGVEAPSEMAVFLLSLVASLNIALFVFNLIPLLPLDGGHVAGALWEGLRRRAAAVFGRPDPGYVDVAKGLPIAYGVSIVLIGMFALLLYADLVKPVRL